MRFMFFVTSVLTGYILLVTSAHAQQQNCGAITNPQERLACFDKQSSKRLSPKPAANAKEDPFKIAIRTYMKDHLFDYDSVKDLEIGEPTKATTRRTDLSPAGIVGYAVPVSYNAKNRMGGYVGKQRQIAFVSDRRVLFLFDEIILNVDWGPVQLNR